MRIAFPCWSRDRDRVVGLEVYLPWRIAIVWIHGEDGTVEQHCQLFETADVDQNRRRVHITEIAFRPRDFPVGLLKRHDDFAASADRTMTNCRNAIGLEQ
jgi:hypothetical protein